MFLILLHEPFTGGVVWSRIFHADELTQRFHITKNTLYHRAATNSGDFRKYVPLATIHLVKQAQAIPAAFSSEQASPQVR